MAIRVLTLILDNAVIVKCFGGVATFKTCAAFAGHHNINFTSDWGYWRCSACLHAIKISFVVDTFGNFASWYLHLYGPFGNGKRALCSHGLLRLYHTSLILGNRDVFFSNRDK